MTLPQEHLTDVPSQDGTTKCLLRLLPVREVLSRWIPRVGRRGRRDPNKLRGSVPLRYHRSTQPAYITEVGHHTITSVLRPASILRACSNSLITFSHLWHGVGSLFWNAGNAPGLVEGWSDEWAVHACLGSRGAEQAHSPVPIQKQGTPSCLHFALLYLF